MRRREIKPGLFENEQLGRENGDYALTFVGLWCIADREGRFNWRPEWIRTQVFPYRPDVPIESILTFLLRESFIRQYEVDGKLYGVVSNLREHQNIHPKEAVSKIPPPGNYITLNVIPFNSNDGLPSLEDPEILKTLRDPEILNTEDPEILKARKKKAELPVLVIGEHFRCTEAELADLVAEDGLGAVEARIQTINDYCAANGKRYKSYAAAYRNFRKRDLEAAKGPKLHLHIHRQETNVDRMKSEGFFNGPGTNGEVVGGSSIRIPGVPSAEGTRPKLVAKAPEVFRRGGEGSD